MFWPLHILSTRWLTRIYCYFKNLRFNQSQINKYTHYTDLQNGHLSTVRNSWAKVLIGVLQKLSVLYKLAKSNYLFCIASEKVSIFKLIASYNIILQYYMFDTYGSLWTKNSLYQDLDPFLKGTPNNFFFNHSIFG